MNNKTNQRELRLRLGELYRRADVSNNRTENPISEYEFVDQLLLLMEEQVFEWAGDGYFCLTCQLEFTPKAMSKSASKLRNLYKEGTKVRFTDDRNTYNYDVVKSIKFNEKTTIIKLMSGAQLILENPEKDNP